MRRAIAYNHNWQVTDLTYQANSDSGTMLAGYHYSYDPDSQVSDFWSYADTSDTGDRTSSTTTWAHATYEYEPDQELANSVSGGYYSGGVAAAYTNWANAPTTDNSLTYDANGNRTDSGHTAVAGNRIAFDGEYYYLYDTNGNRTAKFQSETGDIESATDITIYGWDNRNRMTSLTHKATYGGSPDIDISYSYDVFDRMTGESDSAGSGIDERYVWDGSNLLEVLDGSDNVTERYLNGPAVDQVLATEMAGADSTAGTVNWLMADAQESVRDVAQGVAVSGGTIVSVVDHLIYDAYGQQPVPQTATDPQEQTRVAFHGMLTDPLAGFTNFTSGGSGGGDVPGSSAFGFYYSVGQGMYDSVSETHVSGAAGNEGGAVNPFTYAADDPTVTGLPMASGPMVSDSAVGINTDAGMTTSGAVFANEVYGPSATVFSSLTIDTDSAEALPTSQMQKTEAPSTIASHRGLEKALRADYSGGGTTGGGSQTNVEQPPYSPPAGANPVIQVPGAPHLPVQVVTYQTQVYYTPVWVKVPGNPAKDTIYFYVTAAGTIPGAGPVTAGTWYPVRPGQGSQVLEGVITTTVVTPIITFK